MKWIERIDMPNCPSLMAGSLLLIGSGICLRVDCGVVVKVVTLNLDNHRRLDGVAAGVISCRRA